MFSRPTAASATGAWRHKYISNCVCFLLENGRFYAYSENTRVPPIDPNDLPKDIDVLRKIILDLCNQLRHESSEKDKFRSLLRELIEAQRTRKSEQLSKEQLALFETLWKASDRKRLVNRLAPRTAILLSGLGSSLDRLPVMREQFSQAMQGMHSNARKHITEPGKRLNTATLARGNEAHQYSRRLPAIVAAEKRPIAAADGDVAIGPLGGTVVDLQITVFQIA